MKILYLFPEALPLPRARGIQVAHTLSEMAKQGCDVTLAYVPSEGDPLYGLNTDKRIYCIPIQRNFPYPFGRMGSVKLFYFRLRKILDQVSGDTIIYVRHLKLAEKIITDYPRLTLVYEAHEVFSKTVPTSKKKATFHREAKVFQQASLIVANSNATAKQLLELYGQPKQEIAVIPNGATIPADIPSKNWEAIQSSIVYSGSFFGWKGVDDLVCAVEFLPEQYCIKLIGGTKERLGTAFDRLSPRAKQQITCIDRMPHGDVMRELQAACIAVLPNKPDIDSQFTSPIKLFEYMGAGCAVVASDLPSVREILNEDEAAWFEPGNPASLAKAITALGQNIVKAKAMSTRLHTKAAAYSWSARAQRLIQLLSKFKP